MPDRNALEEEDKKSVGDRIKDARRQKHISQSKLLEMIGGDPNNVGTISKYENGSDHLRIGTLFAIVDALEVPVTALLPPRLLSGWHSAFNEFLKLNPAHQAAVMQLIHSLRSAEKKS